MHCFYLHQSLLLKSLVDHVLVVVYAYLTRHPQPIPIFTLDVSDSFDDTASIVSMAKEEEDSNKIFRVTYYEEKDARASMIHRTRPSIARVPSGSKKTLAFTCPTPDERDAWISHIQQAKEAASFSSVQLDGPQSALKATPSIRKRDNVEVEALATEPRAARSRLFAMPSMARDKAPEAAHDEGEMFVDPSVVNIIEEEFKQNIAKDEDEEALAEYFDQPLTTTALSPAPQQQITSTAKPEVGTSMVVAGEEKEHVEGPSAVLDVDNATEITEFDV